MKASIEIEVSDEELDRLILKKLNEASALYESLRGKESNYDKMADALELVITLYTNS